MKKIIPLTLFLIVSFLNITAQTVEPSVGVDKNTLQIELESLYSIQQEGSEKMKSWSIPSALLRYGFINIIELQFNAPLIKENLYEDDHLIHSLHKFDDVQIGLAVNLWEQKRIVPEASLMVRAIVPIKNGIRLNTFGHVISLNLSNKLTNKLSLNYNIGLVAEPESSTTGFYVTNLCYLLTSKIHFFIENFGDFNQEKLISNNLNIGGGYNFSNNFLIDISLATGTNHNMFYTGGTLTWVITSKKNNQFLQNKS